MLEGGNLRWDRAQHCLTEGSLRSPGSGFSKFSASYSLFPSETAAVGADAPL